MAARLAPSDADYRATSPEDGGGKSPNAIALRRRGRERRRVLRYAETMNRLEGKVAIVTGGASGMGRATVMRFLADGARVVVADLNEANGAETVAVAKASGHGENIAFVRCDVAKEADVAATVALAENRFGRLDIVYLNAGVGGAFGPIAETSVEDWDYTFAVLTRSVFLGMKHASLAMKKHGTAA